MREGREGKVACDCVSCGVVFKAEEEVFSEGQGGVGRGSEGAKEAMSRSDGGGFGRVRGGER